MLRPRTRRTFRTFTALALLVVFLLSSQRWIPKLLPAFNSHLHPVESTCNCSQSPSRSPIRLPRIPLGSHRFLDNGLVEVNPDGPHPIFHLIERAEAQWKEKLAKASSSLDEAVAEYRRRYNRDPPRGFDDWWAQYKLHPSFH